MIPKAPLKQRAADVATELLAFAGEHPEGDANGEGGIPLRNIPFALRGRFIDVRSALFERGVYDPILARFDSFTVQQASTKRVAEALRNVGATL
ncbi:MAG: hypothetical protein WBX15_11605 [Thermoanaerobaculia bacterium]